MSNSAIERITCEGCNRNYAWKPELAGKRVKCKCGHVIRVPEPPAPEEEADGMYDLSTPDDAITFSRSVSQPIPQPAAALPASPLLAYSSPASEAKRDRMHPTNLLDMKRDVHIPLGLLAAGMLLYVGYYTMRYHLNGGGIAVVGLGLTILIAFKAIILVGFAMVAAGPLGVSFGGIGTATLKLAAIAFFCDGITAWVDAGVMQMSGGTFGSGIFGWGILSFPVAIGVYWSLLIYLFGMDSGDSWLVVVILSVFDRIVKMVLAFAILSVILNMGGISLPGTGRGNKISSASTLSMQVESLQQHKALEEAKLYIAKGNQAILGPFTDNWYKARAKNVWFAVSRDFNGKSSPNSLIVEMPDSKAMRQQCLQLRRDFYNLAHFPTNASDLVDNGDTYMEVQIH